MIMFKPKFLNIICYFFVKYIAFYVLLMFKNHDFTLTNISELKNSRDWFYYLWLFLFLPVLNCLIFSAPIYFTFKIKNGIYFVLLMSAILIAEYFLYTYFASEADLKNGIYNAIISILFLFLFFYKHMRSLFKQGIDNNKAP